MRLTDLYGIISRTYSPDGSRWPDFFGVELEIENPSVRTNTAYWVVHDDMSLRDGVEYVTSAPMGGTTLERAVNEFYGMNMTYTNGPRTSTHIHVNISDSTVDQLRAMVVAMYTIEDALFSVIGEMRKWSGYAMPLSEMEPKRLRNILAASQHNELHQAISSPHNRDRYYGFNTCVRKHGTVEFRYFPGGPTKAELEDWLDLVAGAKKATGTSIEQILNIGNNAEALRTWLASFIPASWMERLLNAVGIESMLEKFIEVTAFLPEQDGILSRRDTLVFATRPLVAYIKKFLLGEGGAAYLDQVVNDASVMSLNDWVYHMDRAISADRKANKAKAVQVWADEQSRDDYDDPDYEPEVAEAAETTTAPNERVRVQWTNPADFWDTPVRQQAETTIPAPAPPPAQQPEGRSYEQLVQDAMDSMERNASNSLRAFRAGYGTTATEQAPPTRNLGESLSQYMNRIERTRPVARTMRPRTARISSSTSNGASR